MSFIDLFTAKRDHCRELLALSRRQASLIACDDYTGLLAVLGEKQGLLGRLDQIKQNRADDLDRWPLERDALEPETRTRCEELLAETEDLIAALVEEETISSDSLVERREATRHELAALSDGTRVNDAYRDNLAPATHRHLDLDT